METTKNFNETQADLYLQSGFFSCPDNSFEMRIADQQSGVYKDLQTVDSLAELKCLQGTVDTLLSRELNKLRLCL